MEVQYLYYIYCIVIIQMLQNVMICPFNASFILLLSQKGSNSGSIHSLFYLFLKFFFLHTLLWFSPSWQERTK